MSSVLIVSGLAIFLAVLIALELPSWKISSEGTVAIEALLLSFLCNEALRETLRSVRSLKHWLTRPFKNESLDTPFVAKGVGLLSMLADIIKDDGLHFVLAISLENL